MAVDAQPRELTAETAEGQLLDVLPFCISSHSREAHLLLFMTSYRNGSEDEPNNYGVSSNNHKVGCPASRRKELP
jgi:hypothetical protein